MKSVILFALVWCVVAVSVSSQDCTALANTGNCDFYTQCVEPKFQCGSDGYPLGYGNRYCNKFDEESNCFTQEVSNIKFILLRYSYCIVHGITVKCTALYCII
jgi:hypothetical protein